MVTQHAPGFYWHVHHREVVEWCYSYEERLAYIRTNKPLYEIAIRKKLFQPVRGELPSVLVKAETVYDKSRSVYEKANIAWDKALAVYDSIDTAAYIVAGTARSEAAAARQKAFFARQEAVVAHMPALLALHAEECGCNWTPERGIDFTQENPL